MSDSEKKLHIVCFDYPFPPTYGGIIDVFNKIESLHEQNIEIFLHCFVNEIPLEAFEVNRLVSKIYFYKREKSFFSFLSKTPFSVNSRYSKELLRNLSADNFPILFEGLQSTSVLKFNSLHNRKLYLRLHNLENLYYEGLAKSEGNFLKKLIYYSESKKYTLYNKILARFDAIFTLSKFEDIFVKNNSKNSKYIPVFHGNNKLEHLSEYGNYAFYVGDLRISDNIKSALFLINVFKKIENYNLIIASSLQNTIVEANCKNTSNCNYVYIKNEEHLEELYKNAHINAMYSFQQSGTKLKVINALYKSRFCVINKNMIDDDRVMDLVTISETEEEFRDNIKKLMTSPYQEYKKRKTILNDIFDEKKNALKIIHTIW